MRRQQVPARRHAPRAGCETRCPFRSGLDWGAHVRFAKPPVRFLLCEIGLPVPTSNVSWTGVWKSSYMMLRRGQLGRELVLYEDWNAFHMQRAPSAVLSLQGCELKVKSQGQVY